MPRQIWKRKRADAPYHPDQLRRQSGRHLEGVTRARFCGRYSWSKPNRRVFVHHELPQAEREFQSYKRRYLENLPDVTERVAQESNERLRYGAAKR